MFETDMLARLDANASFKTAVGVDADGVLNVHPFAAPDGASPNYVVYRWLDADPARTMDDKSVDSDLLHFEAFGSSYKEAREIERALRAALDPWREDAPAVVMSVSFAGAHDGAGSFDEASRQRRTFSRVILFRVQLRA